MKSVSLRKITVTLLGAILIGSIASSQMIEAPSGNLATQLATAVTHAGFSASAEAIEMATTHLGHVLNCIVGTDGEGFNADWGNPCGSQGAGIINELASHPQAADLEALVESARALAAQGVTQTSLVAVQTAAAGVRALLSVIPAAG